VKNLLEANFTRPPRKMVIKSLNLLEANFTRPPRKMVIKSLNLLEANLKNKNFSFYFK